MRAGIAALTVVASLVWAGAAEAAWRPVVGLSVPQGGRLADDCVASPFPTDECSVYPGAGGVDVAVNRRGDVVVAWARRRDGENAVEDVQARIRTAGGAWGPVQTLGTTLSYGPYELGGPLMDAAIDDAGNAIVVWPEPVGDLTVVRASQRAPGAAFGAAATLSPAGQDVGQDARVAMSGTGRTIVVWTAANRVQYRSRRRDTSFSPATDVATAGAGSPSVAINDDGAAAIVWQAFSPDALRARVRPAGRGSFAPTRTLSTSRWAGDLEAAIDPQGRATAVWQVGSGNNQSPQARRLTAAGALAGGIEMLTVAGHWAGLTGGPQVASQPGGGAVVAWPDCTGTIGEHRCTLAIRRSTGGPWGPIQYGPRVTEPRNVDLAVDASRAAVLVWTRLVETPGGHGWRAAAARLAPDGTVSDARALTPATSSPDTYVFPKVTTDAAGDAIFAWDLTRPSVGEIVQAEVFDGGAPHLTGVTVPRRANRGAVVAMRAAAADPFGDAQLTWRFGDGAVATGAANEHAYRRCDAFTVRVTARDDVGNAVTRTRRLLVVAPACRIRSRVTADWSVAGARTTVARLRIRGVPRRARVAVRCLGTRCPFRHRAVKPRGRTVNVFRGKPVLHAGQTLEIRIAKPGYIGKVVRYRIRAEHRPRATRRCVPPGRTQARRHC